MPKRILVTGGAGFLGSHLCERLVAEGNEVVCLDNLFTGRRENISALLDDHRFEFVRHDVTEPIILEVDEVFHLACPASPVHYQRNPVRTIRTAVEGTLNMLELAREVKARILIASTSEVYGDPEIHPQPETYWGHVNPIGLRACYDEGKRCAEALAVSYARQYDVQVRIARIFNTYGPRLYENDGRVVSNFILQALRGEPLTVYGEGSQTRSFCYVDDTVEGLCRLMASEHGSDPINVGTQFEFTMLELAKLVIELTGSESTVMNAPLPSDDPKQRRADAARAKEILGWEPKIPLRDGLLLTINYFRQRVQRAAGMLAAVGGLAAKK
ncbi:MAG TPA: UDP-glucuronic acid decarboxylase family protein [Polyangia bacterium]|jgi:UDP-glucuronate decarboxylase